MASLFAKVCFDTTENELFEVDFFLRSSSTGNEYLSYQISVSTRRANKGRKKNSPSQHRKEHELLRDASPSEPPAGSGPDEGEQLS